MIDIEYLDIQEDAQEGNERPSTVDWSLGARELASGMSFLDGLFDRVSGHKESSLEGVRQYLDKVRPSAHELRTQDEDVAIGARRVMQLAAFNDARRGLIWPQQDRQPRWQNLSHPLERTAPWGDPKHYPSVSPTGVTLYYGHDDIPEDIGGRSLQKVVSFDERTSPRFSYDEVSSQTIVDGAKVIKEVYELLRSNDRYILDYYFENRMELRSLVGDDYNSSSGCNYYSALHEYFSQELREGGKLYEFFAFPMASFSYQIGKDEKHEGVGESIEVVNGWGRDWGVSMQFFNNVQEKLFHFALIDNALSQDVPSISREGVFRELGTKAEFRACWDAYVKYLKGHSSLAEGSFVGMGGMPIPETFVLHQIYALIVHTILFECDDVIKIGGSRNIGGHDKFLYIEDLAPKLQAKGIQFAYVEKVVLELHQYFESLGLTLIRSSGQREVSESVAATRERINIFFGVQGAGAQRDAVQMNILRTVPFYER